MIGRHTTPLRRRGPSASHVEAVDFGFSGSNPLAFAVMWGSMDNQFRIPTTTRACYPPTNVLRRSVQRVKIRSSR